MEARMNLSGLEDLFFGARTFSRAVGETSFGGISAITGTLAAFSRPGKAAFGAVDGSVVATTEGTEDLGGTSIYSGSSVSVSMAGSWSSKFPQIITAVFGSHIYCYFCLWLLIVEIMQGFKAIFVCLGSFFWYGYLRFGVLPPWSPTPSRD